MDQTEDGFKYKNLVNLFAQFNLRGKILTYQFTGFY